MPEFQYTALNSEGRPVNGRLAADSRETAIAQLATDGRFVTELSAEAPDTAPPVAGGWPGAGGGRVSARTRAAMLRQLAVGLQAGLPLLAALRVVEEQADQPALARLTADLAEQVQGGESLSDAFASHPATFCSLEVAMARVGETAGLLDEVMGHLADFAERDLAVREQIRSAAAYPLFVLCLALVSIVVIVTFILPRLLETVLDNVDPAALPWPTIVLLGAVDLIASPAGCAAGAGVLLGAWALARWRRRPEGRLMLDGIKLRLPLLGPTLRKIAVARFARTLGTLTRSGIQILEAMRVVRGTMANEVLARQLDDVTAHITQGQSIAEPLRRTGQFPPLLIQVIAMGERTGRLDELLLRTAESYDRETSAALNRLMTILPALFIVALALVVGFILFAVLLPVMTMSTTAVNL